MKKFAFLLFSLPMLACYSIVPTPNDFPSLPPMTVIVEFPTPGFATPTLAPRLRPITSDKMSDAENFYLIMLTRFAAGDTQGIAESVLYPLTVNLPSGRTIIYDQEQFLENYDVIFNEKITQALTASDADDLTLLPEGLRVANGEIWFNLYCIDPACAESEFKITQINN